MTLPWALIPVLIPRGPISGTADQGKEMKVGVWKNMALKPSRSATHCVAEDVGRSRVEHPVALLPPSMVQRFEARSSEANLGIDIPLVFAARRGAPGREIPTQFVDCLCRKWSRQLLDKGASVGTLRIGHVAREEDAHRPRRERPKEFGMPLEEDAKPIGPAPRRQVHEHMALAVGGHPDR